MITCFSVKSRQHAGLIVTRALEYTGDIKVVNTSGSEEAYEVQFDPAVCMNGRELRDVVEGAEPCAVINERGEREAY